MASKLSFVDYMSAFRCIGPDCEDTCCSGWRVSLTQKDHQKLSKLMKKNESLAAYREYLGPASRPDKVGVVGAMGCSSGGGCGMLDAGLCVIHRDFGEDALPTVCATYPRQIIKHPKHWEVHGRLSCPEVARLCLLSKRVPELGSGDPSSLPSISDTVDCSKENSAFYNSQIENISNVIREILALADFTTTEKSYFILYFISKLEAFFHQASLADVEPRLVRTLQKAADLETLSKIRRNLDLVPIEQSHAKPLLVTLLNARLQGVQYSRYNKLVTYILRSYGSAGSKLAEDGVITEIDVFWQDFIARRKLVLAAFPVQIAQYFANFASNYWHQFMFFGERSLLGPARKWLLYHTLMRFMFISHPEVYSRALAGESEAQAAPVLDKVIVEVVQTFMKTIDANHTVQSIFLQSMDVLGFNNMTRLTELLSV